MKVDNVTNSYVIVYQLETDGDILLTTKKRTEVAGFEEYLKKRGLSHEDYAIIAGDIVKSFHSR